MCKVVWGCGCQTKVLRFHGHMEVEQRCSEIAEVWCECQAKVCQTGGAYICSRFPLPRACIPSLGCRACILSPFLIDDPCLISFQNTINHCKLGISNNPSTLNALLFHFVKDYPCSLRLIKIQREHFLWSYTQLAQFASH